MLKDWHALTLAGERGQSAPEKDVKENDDAEAKSCDHRSWNH